MMVERWLIVFWDIVMLIVAIFILAVILYIACSFIALILKKDKVFDRSDEYKRARMLIFVLCLCLSAAYVTMKEYWGTDTIYSFFSKNEFETRYYVHLFPEGSKSKNYLVPADLIVKGNEIGIKRVYWPNGGYTDFGNYDNYDCEEFYMEGHVTLKDNQGREWEVVLTKAKVKK